MKKLTAFILCIAVMFSLCGCSKGEDKAPPEKSIENLSQPYTTSAKVTMRDISADIQITKADGGRCLVTFESPENLKDLSFDYTGELVTVKFGKLKFSVEPGSVPAKAMTSLIIRALNSSFKEQGVTIEEQNDAVVISGTSGGSVFKLIIDKQNGNALTLEIPDDELKVEFYNFSFMK